MMKLKTIGHEDQSMNALNQYLSDYFLTTEQLASACGLSSTRITQLVQDELIPAPSYIVIESSVVISYVFGPMEAKGSTDGHYFHPSTATWIQKALRAIADFGQAGAQIDLKNRFEKNLNEVLAEFDQSIWRLRDSFTDDGMTIQAGLQARVDSMWNHFIKGTFGLCVAKPDSERAIARKEILQEKLTALSDDGKRKHFSAIEATELNSLIDEFAMAAMPFSPADYPRSSRKRLVEDLRGVISAL